MDEWDPRLGWLIGGVAVLLTVLIVVIAWPTAKPRVEAALHGAVQAEAPVEAADGAAPVITESRTVGTSRVHRID